MIAAGFARYGCDDQAARIFAAIAQAASYFSHSRLPELFAGFSRDAYPLPVSYPVACHPQAWAAGSVPYMLTTILGLAPDAMDCSLRVVRPVLPEFLSYLEISGLKVGQAKADLRFERAAHGTAVQAVKVEGPLKVLVEL